MAAWEKSKFESAFFFDFFILLIAFLCLKFESDLCLKFDGDLCLYVYNTGKIIA